MNPFVFCYAIAIKIPLRWSRFQNSPIKIFANKCYPDGCCIAFKKETRFFCKAVSSALIFSISYELFSKLIPTPGHAKSEPFFFVSPKPEANDIFLDTFRLPFASFA